MSDVIKWLESPEGENWSRRQHFDHSDNRLIALVTVKDDSSYASVWQVMWRA